MAVTLIRPETSACVIATASASAASSCAGWLSPSIRWIIAPTWDFSARPLLVTERFSTAGLVRDDHPTR